MILLQGTLPGQIWILHLIYKSWTPHFCDQRVTFAQLTLEQLGEKTGTQRWRAIDLEDFFLCCVFFSVACLSFLSSAVLLKSPSLRVSCSALTQTLPLPCDLTAKRHMNHHSQTHTHTGRRVCDRDYFSHCICHCTLFLSPSCYQLPVDTKLCWHFTSFLL